MSRKNCRILDTGDTFPEMRFNSVEGEVISLPDYFGERWNILLFYRGQW